MPHAPCGYHGRYLRIDLSDRRFTSVPLPEEVLRHFIGGSGLGTWLLIQESAGQLDPLDAAAPLAFVFSPLVGSPLTTSAKFAVVGKSPLTQRINDSLSSSYFAIAAKKTGYDAIVVVGAADAPTTIVIDPDGVRFEDASSVWRLSSRAACEMLKKRIGAQYRFAAIGPAGERLVRFATVSHDARHAGRGGMGAVMGSKQLKAIAVRGDRQVVFAHPDRLTEFSKRLSRQSLGPATAKYRELGTISNLATFNRLGALPTRNFQGGVFPEAAALTPEAMGERHSRTRASCAACTIGCEHIFHVPGLGDGVRMEYESLFAFGPLCGIDDADVVFQASALCDEFGMDTISTGATIAFAMECAERHLIEAPTLRFGNGPAMLEMLHSIGTRTGLGELLSHGTRAAAKEIGNGSADFAPHVKGLEIPGYEPRALQTMALGFAVGARGADHNRSGAYQVDFSDRVDRLNVGRSAVGPAIETEDEAAVMDSLILCKFLRGVFEDKLQAMADMLHLVCGWDTGVSELRTTASRITTAKKWYNIRQGWTPDEDTLPARFFSETLPDGASRGAILNRDQLDSLIQDYNLARGWSEEGWVPKQRLAELGIPN